MLYCWSRTGRQLMTSRRRHSFVYPLFYRTVTAVLIAVLGVGASWAPPVGGAGCGACVGQSAADAGCVDRAVGETAAGIDSCCHGEADHGPARPAAPAENGDDGSHRHDDGGCPGRCAACCLPVARTTALEVGFDAGLALEPTTLELVATPSSPHS